MISPSCHQLYKATVANACGCTQGPFWLPRRIILVALGNCPGWPGEFQGSWIEAIQNLPDVRFFFLPLLTYVSKTRIQRCLCREVDGIWQYRIGGNLTIFDKDHDAAEEGRSQTEAFATIAMYKGVPRTGRTPPLSVSVRNREYLQLKILSHPTKEISALFVCKTLHLILVYSFSA
jgi:hypothetical protein